MPPPRTWNFWPGWVSAASARNANSMSGIRQIVAPGPWPGLRAAPARSLPRRRRGRALPARSDPDGRPVAVRAVPAAPATARLLGERDVRQRYERLTPEHPCEVL